MLKSYFKTAWRNLWRNKTTTFINLFGLSVGITAAVLILMWVQNERSFDSYHPDAQNIYRIVNHIKVSKNEDWIWETSPLAMASAAKQDIPEIATATRIMSEWEPQVFNINNKLFSEKKCAYIDNNWFDVFHYDFKQGNIISFVKDPYGMILTESEAKKLFGDQESIGQTIKIDSTNFTVRAVVKDNPSNSSFQFDVLMPLSVFITNQKKFGTDTGWGNFNYITFLKLTKTANINVVVKKLNVVIAKNRGKDNNATISLHSLTSMHFDTRIGFSSFKHTEKKKTYIFSVLALMLLLTACINYVNLTTARASLRAKEVSIRKIVGAYSKHLFSQFITESVVVSVLALAVSLLLIKLSLPYFNQLTDMSFVSPFSSLMVWKVLLGTLIATIILNGIYPALLLSSFKPLNVFRGKSLLKVKDSGLRKGLVVFQFVLSVMLIIGTVVVFRQLQFVQSSNPGYNRSQIVSMQLPFKSLIYMKEDARSSFIDNIKYELSKNVNTQLVTSSNQPIVNVTNTNSGSSKWDGKDSLFNPTVHTLSVDARYQKVFDLKMKEGRWYFTNEKADLKNYILNETAVKVFDLHQPVIGQRFSFNKIEGTIIGIVKDFHHGSMHDKIEPVLIHNNPAWMTYISVKAREGNIMQTLATMEAVWHKFLPDEPFDYTFMDDTFNALYKSDLKTSKLILIFSIITIIISALGLFGLAAFTAERKRKEIGIRKVLGATITNITSLLSKEFVILVGIAIVIASPIAWWGMNKWLEDFAYRINISWWMFMFAGVIALFIALLNVSALAIKAAVANPVKSLRTE
ncbi:MAG: ABC transporter permease [Bacteroidetes bacterium]|nr:ABC transporter permease [Bacteroidota bacterium]